MSDINASSLPAAQAGFRFLLELAALICWGIIGWQVVDGGARWILAVVVPIVAAATWGTFRTPDDQSAGGQSPIAVPGAVRLVLEVSVLLGAAILTALVWRPVVGIALAAAVVLHYLGTLRRVRWLLAQRLPS